MQLIASRVRDTPVFVLPVHGKGWWDRLYGGVERHDGWTYPGYFPYGAAFLNDLRVLSPRQDFDASAIELSRQVSHAEASYQHAERQWQASQMVDLPLPLGWRWPKNEPYLHQRLGIANALHWWRRFFLWEMGTGKTKTIIETLRLLRAQGRFRRAVVLAPPVVLPTWAREVRQHTDDEFTTLLWGDVVKDEEALPELSAKSDVVIVSYTRARLERERTARTGQPNRLQALGYDVIIADESHSIGNYESSQTAASLELSVTASRRYILSGTAADHPAKLYPQLRFLGPQLMPMSWTDFKKRYFEFNPTQPHLIAKFKWTNELNAKVDQIATRMKKKECLDLPEMVVTDIPFELGRRQKARYNELVLEMRASFEPILAYADVVALKGDIDTDDDEEDPTVNPIQIGPDQVGLAKDKTLFDLPNGATRVNKLLQLTSGFMKQGLDLSVCDGCEHLAACAKAKIKPYTRACHVVKKKPALAVIRDVENPKLEIFEQLLDNILQSDVTNKVLVWANFTPELDDLEAVCKAKKVGYIRIDGKTTKKIESMQEKFETDPACRVSIGIVSAGVGITLVAANYSIYYNLPWNGVHYHQSIERNNRPGQRRSMTAYRMIARDTIVEYVASALAYKDLVSFTLLERIACSQCDDQRRCSAQNNRPFRPGCKYQPEMRRPTAKVDVVG